MDIQEWLDRSLMCLGRAPEKDALRKELYEHYEDHLDVLLSKGVPAREAMEQAVSALGNPKEIGLLLRRVHRPWVDRLLRPVWMLIALALLMIVFHFADVMEFIIDPFHSYRNTFPEVFEEFQDVDRMGEKLEMGAWRHGSCDATATLGQYRVSVESAGSCFAQYGNFPPMTAPARPSITYALVRFQGPPWRKPDDSAVEEAFWAEDNLGCVYRPRAVGDCVDMSEPVGMLRFEGGLKTWKIAQNLFSTYYVVWFENKLGDGFSAADELKLHMRRGGREIVLPIRFDKWSFKGFRARPEEETALKELYKEDYLEWTEKNCVVSGEAEGYRALVSIARISPLDATEYDPEMEQARRLDLFLLLSGDQAHLPMTETELLSALTLTDHTGTRLLQDRLLDNLGEDWISRVSVGEPMYYDGLYAYQINVRLDSISPYYDLCVNLDGVSIPLRINMEQGETE